MEAHERKFVYDPNSPGQRRATAIARADDDFLARLVELRRELGLTQAEVAARLGIQQSSVAAFERPENDPRMSTVRRYAHAIGVYTEHQVRVDALEWGTATAARCNEGAKAVPTLRAQTGEAWNHVLDVMAAANTNRTDFALGA